MMVKQYFLLTSYLLEVGQVKFSWGNWDCNTLISRWIDKLNGEKSSEEIVGKYSSVMSATKFYKRYIPYNEYLNRWGYSTTNDLWQTGDIVIEPHDTWACAHLVHGDHLYSMHPELNLIKIPLSKLDQCSFETWRL